MDHFHYKDGCYHAEDVSLEALAEEIGTPFYCYSSATLERHYTVFNESFGDLSPLVCYAVKANGAQGVLATLARLGCGADVVSQGEIMQALAAGISAEKIVFSGVGKTKEEMAYALEQGILQFNVESEPELKSLSEVASIMGKTARVALRVNPDVAAGTHAKISTGAKEVKFGISMAHAPDVFALGASLPGLDIAGVSVHIGSQLTSLEPFNAAFARVRDFVLSLREAGHTIRVVDLGGGLGVPYELGQEPPPPSEYAKIVRKNMEDLGCELMFEPGRLISANSGVMVARVIYIKETEGKIFVIVDAAMNDLIRPTLYDAYHHVVPAKEGASNAPTIEADIVGPICETGDIFAAGREIPLPEEGDLLVFRTVGAYGATMASTYNARPLLAEVMVKGDKHSVIRPRQTYAELMSRDKLPSWL